MTISRVGFCLPCINQAVAFWSQRLSLQKTCDCLQERLDAKSVFFIYDISNQTRIGAEICEIILSQERTLNPLRHYPSYKRAKTVAAFQVLFLAVFIYPSHTDMVCYFHVRAYGRHHHCL